MDIEICEYRIWCPKCGDKSATWFVDQPTDILIKESFDLQYEKVTFRKHATHGTLTFIDERHFSATKEEAVQIKGRGWK